VLSQVEYCPVEFVRVVSPLGMIVTVTPEVFHAGKRLVSGYATDRKKFGLWPCPFSLSLTMSGHENANRAKPAAEDEARFFQFDCCCRLPGRRVRNVFDDRDEPVSRQMHDDRGEFDVVRGRFRREWPVDSDGGT
jgi:hypothetical protein